MDKITDQQEWERFRDTVGQLAYALSQTLLRLSPSDRDTVLAPWCGLTDEILASLTGPELGAIVVDTLLAAHYKIVTAGLAVKSPAIAQQRCMNGYAIGIKPSAN